MKPRRPEPLERLVDAHPAWVDTGPGNTRSPNRRGVMVSFDCPIHHDCYVAVPIDPPIDGGDQFDERAWKRTGETFEDLTLSPSIRILGGEDGCEWHGFIKAGRFQNCGDAK